VVVAALQLTLAAAKAGAISQPPAPRDWSGYCVINRRPVRL
jgi:hypothetical protein